MIGYMLTWTTYGSWLQGDQRGWVKDGVICSVNHSLQKANTESLKSSPVRFTTPQQSIIYNAILKHAVEKQHEIFALSITNNHVHLLIREYDEGPSRLTARYKNNAKKQLGEIFIGRPVWTKGSNTRSCNTLKDLRNMIEYIKKHETITPFVYIAEV